MSWSTPIEIGGVFSPMLDVVDPFGALLAPVRSGDEAPAYGTPEWWFERLLAQISGRVGAVTMYEAYYRGFHRLTFATTQFRDVFGALFSNYADNWCQLVVDAAAERLRVEGFRFGARDEPADQAAWDIWQANQLDAESALAHTQAITSGSAYIVVGPADEETGQPTMTVTHPLRAAIESDPRNRRKTLAGLHVWSEPDGVARAVLYLPDVIVWWLRPADAEPDDPWIVVGPDDALDASGPNPWGVVPIVCMANSPALWDRSGTSDLEVMRRNQDAINKLTTDMLVASEFAAYPQRWATGLDVPKDPETGEPLPRPQFLASLNRLWASEDETTQFGSFPAANLSNYVGEVENLIQRVAAQTRTPPHYLLGQSGAFPSGESLKATETGLVAKCRAKQATFGEAWEQAMRLAFLIDADTKRAKETQAEVIWADPESVSEAERVDALVKMASLGVPKPVLWAKWGASPQEIQRWQALARGEQLPPAASPVPPSAAATASAGATPATPTG